MIHMVYQSTLYDSIQSKFTLFGLIVCAVLFSGQSVDAQVLDQFKWKHRILIIQAHESSVDSLIQIKDSFAQEKEMVKDRRLLLMELVEGQLEIMNAGHVGLTWSSDYNLQFMNPDKDFQITLIGLDGEIKQIWNRLVSVEEVFQLIDAMPMRINELRRKN